MDVEWLAERLEAGDSIEAIAREAGKAPSTVGYWVKKYGLGSAHAERHAPRGGIDRETLAALVEEGLAVRAMATRLGVSYSTVRHWLQRHSLETARSARTRALSSSPDAAVALADCPRHGRTAFGRRSQGAWRCLACRTDYVTARRRRVKQILVAEHGGGCRLCGYSRSTAALQFHHVDPMTKAFALSTQGVARSLEKARAEARKCVLVCANCHAEVEAGLATIPL